MNRLWPVARNALWRGFKNYVGANKPLPVLLWNNYKWNNRQPWNMPPITRSARRRFYSRRNNYRPFNRRRRRRPTRGARRTKSRRRGRFAANKPLGVVFRYGSDIKISDTPISYNNTCNFKSILDSNKDLCLEYSGLFDQFKVVSVVRKFYLRDSEFYTQKDYTKVIMWSAYDPDGRLANYDQVEDYRKDMRGKWKMMHPAGVYTSRLRPKFSACLSL